MKTWSVTVKDLGTGVTYTVAVETATNYRAAAAVRALDLVYAMPGMTWMSNLFVTACMRTSGSGRKAA